VESEPGRVAIPADNPFRNTAGARPEIWALGMRNPWRFSFDRFTGDLWIGDVGQDSYEEIDFQSAASRGGENYGWNVMEGMHCFQSQTCTMTGLTLPVQEYTHLNGCSVTGGFVYRGRGSPGMRGIYLYADYCNGQIWGLEHQNGFWVNRLLLASGFALTTFGEDEAGEIYAANQNGGTIHRIDGPRAPRVREGAVVNAASFVAGVSPGSFATVFAAGVLDDPGIVTADRLPLPTTLAGVSVSVGGIAAPIQALANVNGQELVNFQTPFELTGLSAQVVVTRQGQSSGAINVLVMPLQPAIYTLDGTQAVVVHNEGFRLVTAADPLEHGEFAFLYAAGLGPVTNQPATGAAASSGRPAIAGAIIGVTVGGASSEVSFAGLAPGYAGVYQVNFRVPPGAGSGSQELVLTADNVISPMVRVPVR